MVVRRKRRINKKRGSRTHHGNKKNWRGSGNRGGHGRAGGHKHKYASMYSQFGVKVRLKPKQVANKVLNLKDLNSLIPIWLAQKKCEKDAQNKIVLDGARIGITKLLGGGETGFELVLKNISVSKNAAEKLNLPVQSQDKKKPSHTGVSA